MNKLSLYEECETVSLASLNPASTESTSQLISTQEFVQPLPTNIKVDQEPVSIEDSSLPKGDASMPQVSVKTPPAVTYQLLQTFAD